MTIRNRLIFLLVFLIALIIIGRAVTGSYGFILNQFWFTAGFFLLILLSLIDQPYFSKDANIFVNAITAWVSLLLVTSEKRDGIWWGFFGWASYLIISSYILMWIRSKELREETRSVQIVSRINRQIGRPEAIFSAFFLWGCVHQFGSNSSKLDALFLFWAVFMIINMPALAMTLDKLLILKKKDEIRRVGLLVNIVSPRVAEVELLPELSTDLIGHGVNIMNADDKTVAMGILVDDHVVTGKRIGRVAIVRTDKGWTSVSDKGYRKFTLEVNKEKIKEEGILPISVVDAGTEIGKIVFQAHPNTILSSGEVLWVKMNQSTKAFYQVISAVVCLIPISEGKYIHSVRVTAGQLGVWEETRCRFEPVTWVAPAGQIIYKATSLTQRQFVIPARHETVGTIPNADFPVHVSIEDIVTHNTAIVGVTGSGKSYLAFNIIEAMIRCGIKVLILDISRQHDIYLKDHDPTALKTTAQVKEWYESNSFIGIHQFAIDDAGYPKITADFVTAAFKEASKATLERGKDLPARLCVVFEEAHSLIPEWNQVAQPSDNSQVNRTARTILQGRKYGMGALIITQRTANVTKTILNQCNTIFAFQSFDQTGLDFLKNYMGEEYANAISTLPMRHAILVGKASSSARPLILSVKDLANHWKELRTEEKAEEALERPH